MPEKTLIQVKIFSRLHSFVLKVLNTWMKMANFYHKQYKNYSYLTCTTPHIHTLESMKVIPSKCPASMPTWRGSDSRRLRRSQICIVKWKQWNSNVTICLFTCLSVCASFLTYPSHGSGKWELFRLRQQHNNNNPTGEKFTGKVAGH